MIDRRSMLTSGLGLAAAAGVAAGARSAAAARVAPGAVAADAAAQGAAAAGSPGAAAGRARTRRIDLQVRFMTTRAGRTFERGREIASYDFHDDGLVTYHVSSHSDDPRIARDAIYTLDAAWRPREAFVRLQVDGRYEGSGWFRFEPTRAHSDTFNAARGPVAGVLELDTPVRAFVAHPVSTDVMLVAAWERGGAKRQALPGAFTSSADPYGRVGPSLEPSQVWLEYAGREVVATPAGPLEAERHELFTAADAAEPLESLWTLPGTCVFVRAEARGQYRTVYELVDYRDSGAARRAPAAP